jgi:hypothetical protein
VLVSNQNTTTNEESTVFDVSEEVGVSFFRVFLKEFTEEGNNSSETSLLFTISKSAISGNLYRDHTYIHTYTHTHTHTHTQVFTS